MLDVDKVDGSNPLYQLTPLLPVRRMQWFTFISVGSASSAAMSGERLNIRTSFEFHLIGFHIFVLNTRHVTTGYLINR
jgi:hypothetical protein